MSVSFETEIHIALPLEFWMWKNNLNRNKAAKELGVKTTTFYDLMASGKQCFVVGGKLAVIYSPKELRASER